MSVLDRRKSHVRLGKSAPGYHAEIKDVTRSRSPTVAPISRLFNSRESGRQMEKTMRRKGVSVSQKKVGTSTFREFSKRRNDVRPVRHRRPETDACYCLTLI